MEDLDAICVTKGPGLVGSLHIGLQVAKTLSLAYDKPLIGVHHIAGHIYANNYEKDIVYPALCLVVSGGNTELVLMKHPYSFEVIGETLDDAVGEAYDKVGRVLNLPYPGGPVLDKMAHLGKASYHLPKPLDDDSYNFSFSGLKSAVINLAHNHRQKGLEINQNDLATSFQNVVVDVLVDKTIRAAKEYGVKDHPCKYINEEVENKKDSEVKITEMQSQEVKIDKSKIEDVETKSVESNLNIDIKEEFKNKHNKNTVIENIILGEEKCYLKCAHCNQFFNKGYLLDKVFYCKDCAKKDFLNYLNKVKKEKMKNV